MKVKRMVRRLFAVGTGAAMLGATAMGAMAADLSGWGNGQLFVKEGVMDALIVVGKTAKAEDTLAAADIAANVPYSVSSSGATAVVTGDAWQVGTSSKYLEMANSNTTASGLYGETFRDMVTFIGDDEMDALANGVWATNENDYDYSQFLYFDTDGQAGIADNRIVKYVEDDLDEKTADYLYFKSNRQIARYKMEFASTAQSDVTDSSGTSDTTGTYLDDFENTQMNLMGKDYTVVMARRTTVTGADDYANGIKLTLMSGATTDVLVEGDSKTYTVGDKEYDVTVTFTDADEAKFSVNGEATNKLKVGETYVLKDKSEVGVSEILYQDYAGGVHSATFFVGAQKMVLQDDAVHDSIGSYNVKIGSEDIDGTKVMIVGTDNNATFTISTIEVNMTGEDNYFVPVNGKLSEVIAANNEEEEVLMGGAFDIEYKGLTTEDTEELKLKSSSARRYKLQLFDGDGKQVDIPVAYADNTSLISISEDGVEGIDRANQKRLHFTEADSVVEDLMIYKDDYFIVTGGTASDGSAKSYLLQYKGQDKTTKTTPKIKFKNMGSGETLEYSVSATNATAVIKLGGYSFNVYGQSGSIDDQPILVDLDGTGGAPARNGNVSFVDYYGSQWAFIAEGNHTGGYRGLALKQTTPNADDYDNHAPSDVVLNISVTSGPELRAALTGLTLVTPDGETEISYGYTSMGAFATLAEPSSDPDEFTLLYPKQQRLPQVFVTSGAVSSSTKSGKTAVAKVVDATKLDTEVTSLWAQNTIVVGGPCVNTLAAQLMGNPADCAEGFNPGKAKVKVFENSGKVAMLVAGYSGEDTRCAGKVLAHRASELSGSEVEIECTSLKYKTATIAAPTVEVAAPAAAAATTTTE